MLLQPSTDKHWYTIVDSDDILGLSRTRAAQAKLHAAPYPIENAATPRHAPSMRLNEIQASPLGRPSELNPN